MCFQFSFANLELRNQEFAVRVLAQLDSSAETNRNFYYSTIWYQNEQK